MTVFFIKTLDRCIISDQRDNDLTVVRVWLPADDNIVIIENAGLNHAVAANAKNKVLAFADEIDRQHHLLIDALFCKNGLPSGNAADDRKLAHAAVINRL